MFYIRLKYKFLEKNLFIFCSHGHGQSEANLSSTILFFKIKKIPLEEMKTMEIENYTTCALDKLHKETEKWLSEQLESLKNNPNFKNIDHIIFMADVNLGRPGYNIYPDFLLSNFIQMQFTPFDPKAVEIILFSSSLGIIDNARSKIPASTKLLNACDLLTAVKSKLPPDFKVQHAAPMQEEIKTSSQPDAVVKEDLDKNKESSTKGLKPDNIPLEVSAKVKVELEFQNCSAQQEEPEDKLSSILGPRLFSGEINTESKEAVIHQQKKQATRTNHINSKFGLFSDKEEADKTDLTSDIKSTRL
ncbi:hypothetical protein [Legionella gresilensis]|uniref:hypothetical protein n=1 Tax=Legionella gresilensis TaxID=91823 RepID=UPI001041307E|nr:hypothetical protein [Legionella gresilensis]